MKKVLLYIFLFIIIILCFLVRDYFIIEKLSTQTETDNFKIISLGDNNIKNLYYPTYLPENFKINEIIYIMNPINKTRILKSK